MISTDDIDALLPQTQCTKCGFAGCRPYADAIASGSATINRCPPGGAAGIERLAVLLDCDIFKVDPAQIDKVKVTMTVVDGRIVYERK